MHEEVKEGFVDRFAGGHLDQAAIAAQDRGERQMMEERCAINPGAAEFICRREPDRQIALSKP
ncbi:hypothetical protein D3C72_1856510 [compost metagenome]